MKPAERTQAAGHDGLLADVAQVIESARHEFLGLKDTTRRVSSRCADRKAAGVPAAEPNGRCRRQIL